LALISSSSAVTGLRVSAAKLDATRGTSG